MRYRHANAGVRRGRRDLLHDLQRLEKTVHWTWGHKHLIKLSGAPGHPDQRPSDIRQAVAQLAQGPI